MTNKMKCTCGALSCYLCGERIKDYSHFWAHNRKPCNCGKPCELFTSTENMEKLDRNRRRAVGRKPLQEEGMAEADIMQVLASPPPKKPTPRVGAANGGRAALPAQAARRDPLRAVPPQPRAVRPAQPARQDPLRAVRQQPRPQRDPPATGRAQPMNIVRQEPVRPVREQRRPQPRPAELANVVGAATCTRPTSTAPPAAGAACSASCWPFCCNWCCRHCCRCRYSVVVLKVSLSTKQQIR